MSNSIVRVAMFAAFMLGGTSCHQPDGSPSSVTASRPAASPKPATQPIGKHWIQDQQLRTVMADVNRRMQEHYPRRLPDDPEQPVPPELSRTLTDAGKLAGELARASERIPLAIEGNKSISADDRAGFLDEARTLRRHALDLSEAAAEGRVEAMQRSLLGINATCIACHSKYKDISGDIAVPKQASREGVNDALLRSAAH